MLWLGERSAGFRFPGTVAVHDGAMFLAVALLTGHLFLALVWPATRPALRGIVRGTVRIDWARRHHAAWRPPAVEVAPPRLAGARFLTFAAVLLLGGLGTVLIVGASLSDGSVPAATEGPAPVVATVEPPFKPGADTLVIQAPQATQAGQFAEAATLLRQAIRQAPKRASLRTSLGFALAQAGDLATAETELESAISLDRAAPEAHLYLGAVRVNNGKRASGRRELRTYLRLAPRSENAAVARRLLRER